MNKSAAIAQAMLEVAAQATEEDGQLDAATRAKLDILEEMAYDAALPKVEPDGLGDPNAEATKQAAARIQAHREAFVRRRVEEKIRLRRQEQQKSAATPKTEGETT